MKQVGLAELTSSVQAPSSGRMGVDYTHILRAFSGWRSQSEALPGGSEVCNNSHCFIRSTVFNLDKCTAWQRTAEWVGVRVGARGWRAAGLFGFQQLCPSPPLPTAQCYLQTGAPQTPQASDQVGPGGAPGDLDVAGPGTCLGRTGKEGGEAEVAKDLECHFKQYTQLQSTCSVQAGCQDNT